MEGERKRTGSTGYLGSTRDPLEPVAIKRVLMGTQPRPCITWLTGHAWIGYGLVTGFAEPINWASTNHIIHHFFQEQTEFSNSSMLKHKAPCIIFKSFPLK
jgi:hypothetical protein